MVAECYSFWGKKLLTRLTECSSCSILVILVISHFGFDVMPLVLNVPFPNHCLLFTFIFLSTMLSQILTLIYIFYFWCT